MTAPAAPVFWTRVRNRTKIHQSAVSALYALTEDSRERYFDDEGRFTTVSHHNVVARWLPLGSTAEETAYLCLEVALDPHDDADWGYGEPPTDDAAD